MLCVLAWGWGGGVGGGHMSVYLYLYPPDYILNNFIILQNLFSSVLLFKFKQTS